MSNINIPVTGCIQNPTALQEGIAFYYRIANPFITNWLNQAQSSEYFGKESDEYYDLVNNFYYLLQFISVVRDEQQIDINNGINNPCSYYGNQFTCFINHFKCLNIDITPLLAIFGYTCTGQSGPIGIGVMIVDSTFIVG